MSIRDWLHAWSASPRGDTETVQRIVRELGRIDPQRARHIAAFAYLLSRAAGADLHITAAKTATMVALVRAVGHLSAAQAAAVVEIAKSQNRRFGGTENFLVTREFRAIASEMQCRELLRCLFAVCAADNAITAAEEAQLRQVASELGLSHSDYVQIRLTYAHRRTVLHVDRDGA